MYGRVGWGVGAAQPPSDNLLRNLKSTPFGAGSGANIGFDRSLAELFAFWKTLELQVKAHVVGSISASINYPTLNQEFYKDAVGSLSQRNSYLRCPPKMHQNSPCRSLYWQIFPSFIPARSPMCHFKLPERSCYTIFETRGLKHVAHYKALSCHRHRQGPGQVKNSRHHGGFLRAKHAPGSLASTASSLRDPITHRQFPKQVVGINPGLQHAQPA